MKKNNTLFLIWSLAIIMAVMPIGETPHLVQKLELLSKGWLNKAVDWFDLLVHGGLLVVALVYTVWFFIKGRTSA